MSTPNMLIHVFVDFALGTGVLEDEGTIHELLSQLWKHSIVQIASACRSIKCSLCYGSCTTPEKQPPRRNPPPSTTLHLAMHLGPVLLAPHRLRLINCIARQRSIIRHSRRIALPFLSPRVEWPSALHHHFWSVTLHLVTYRLDTALQPWKPIPWSSLHPVPELSWRQRDGWRSAAIDLAESCWFLCAVCLSKLFKVGRGDPQTWLLQLCHDGPNGIIWQCITVPDFFFIIMLGLELIHLWTRTMCCGSRLCI